MVSIAVQRYQFDCFLAYLCPKLTHMKFHQRFAYFSVGLTLGLIFVFFVWSGKGVSCNYFPNARVLNALRNQPFYYSPAADSTLAQGWINKDDIKRILTKGDVDFDRSQTDMDKQRFYIIEGETQTQKKVEITVQLFPDRALLKEINTL